MNYVDEFRGQVLVRRLAAVIARVFQPEREYLPMDSCSGRIHALLSYGEHGLMPNVASHIVRNVENAA